MSASNMPLLVVSYFESGGSKIDGVIAKGLVSSLQRSLFSGPIKVFHDRELHFYKVERKALQEIAVRLKPAEESDVGTQQSSREFLVGICDLLRPGMRQWVIMAHRRSLTLRNVDHFIPSETAGPYAPTELDFLWARAGMDDVSNHSATPGLWAVRGEHLPLVLERLKEEWGKESGADRVDEEEIWTRVVHELPLRKRAFEKGEVVAPRIGAVDWEAVSNAAFVTVPDWPEKEAWKFLQALYFGTYLGDETGMMLNILEA